MSEMRIQEALTGCCGGIKQFGANAVDWVGKTGSAVGSFIMDGARKVADFIRPFFESVKQFYQENQDSIIVATIAFTVGAILTAIISNVFCKGTNTAPQQQPQTQTQQPQTQLV